MYMMCPVTDPARRPATLSPAISQSLSSRNTLRRNRHTEWVDLGGHEYKVVPVALIAQGHYSEAFNIVGGFQVNNTARRVPAILKRVSEVDLGNGYSKTREEIEFLKRVSQLRVLEADEMVLTAASRSRSTYICSLNGGIKMKIPTRLILSSKTSGKSIHHSNHSTNGTLKTKLFVRSVAFVTHEGISMKG